MLILQSKCTITAVVGTLAYGIVTVITMLLLKQLATIHVEILLAKFLSHKFSHIQYCRICWWPTM